MATKAQLEGLLPNSSFVFQGTVEETGVSKVANLQPHAGTVIAKVDAVFRAPEILANIVGTRITVQLLQEVPLNVGQQYIFFAAPLVYGENIAVREVGHIDVPSGIAQRNLLTSISELVRKEPDRRVQERLSQSEIVVAGKVTAVRPAPQPAGRPVTFDDPDWHEAVIQVDNVLSGTMADKSVVVVFPMSTDVKWYKTPKFYVGQEGVWILSKHEFARMNRTAYVAFHPLDFQAREKTEHIRTLIPN